MIYLRHFRRWLSFFLSAALLSCSADSNTPTAQTKAARPTPSHLVQVGKVTKRTLSYSFQRSGSLRALREASIISQEEGAVLQVAVREGDRVDAGDVLVRLDDRVLSAEVDKATARRQQFQSDVKRLSRLRKKKLSSEEALTKAKTDLQVAVAEERLLQTRREYMTIRAPFAGTISQRLINVGDVAPKHHHLLTLVDPSSLVTDVGVSELLLPGIQAGDEVTVRIDALGDQRFSGKISRIYPTVDPDTRRGKIEIVLEQVPERARAGQFCRVLLTSRRQDALLFPLAALRRDEKGEYVFAIDEQGHVRRRSVRTGVRLSDSVEALSGVQVEDQVVTSGFLGLRDGQKVKTVGSRAARHPQALLRQGALKVAGSLRAHG